MCKKTVSTNLSTLDLVTTMVDSFSNDTKSMFNTNQYNSFIDRDFNPTLAKLCVLMELSEQDALHLHHRLEESGYKSVILRKCFQMPTSKEVKKNEVQIDRSSAMEASFSRLFDAQDELQIGNIDLLENSPVNNKILKKGGFGLFNRKKNVLPVFEVRDDVFAKKPVHLLPLREIENTIFS